MSGTSSPGGAGVPPQLDTSEAHSARVWNYLLGGKDNFGAACGHRAHPPSSPANLTPRFTQVVRPPRPRTR